LSLFACFWAFLLMGVLAPRASAQNDGVIDGIVIDQSGKPWSGLVVHSTSDQGAKQQTKTGNDGKFVFRNLHWGDYVVLVDLPGQDKPYRSAVKVQNAEPAKVEINFSTGATAESAEEKAAKKSEEDNKAKFEAMKKHFEAGNALLTQASQVRSDIPKAAPDQQGALKQKLTDLGTQAVTEMEAAKAGVSEKDANANIIWAKLGEAYDAAGRPDDAANAYKQAIALKPMPNYYNNLGGILGRQGKVEDALAAYQKSAELDPTNAAQAWRNAGITLYNAGKMKEAIEPLKKSTDLDPKSAQGWYLLGAPMVGAMEYKKVGDKLEVVVLPGTVEAYQKAVELDPNGPIGKQAKEGLDQLAQIAPGIDTQIKKRVK
jgi:tetratricopeptide (TPR) repeat protein